MGSGRYNLPFPRSVLSRQFAKQMLAKSESSDLLIFRHSRAGGNPFRPVILSEAKNLEFIPSPFKGEGEGEDRAVEFETSRFRATGEFLSFV